MTYYRFRIRARGIRENLYGDSVRDRLRGRLDKRNARKAY